MSDTVVTLGIPKGSLQESTLAAFERVGLSFGGSSRDLWLSSNDAQIRPVLLKPQEIPVYVGSGRIDAGLSGKDWIVEQGVLPHIVTLAELPYARQSTRPIRWVLAVPEANPVRTVDDLRDACERKRAAGEEFVISTELVGVSRMWLARSGIDARVEFSWGATEAKAGTFADAIIEATETGASLKSNQLREVAEIFVSRNQFIANRSVFDDTHWKARKLRTLAELLRGAVRASTYVQVHVIASNPLDIAAILSPESRIARASVTEDGGFRAIALVPRAAVSTSLASLVEAGATDVWVSAVSAYFSSAL